MAGPWLCVEVYLRDLYSGLLVACASHGALRPAAIFLDFRGSLTRYMTTFPWLLVPFLGK